MPLLVTEGDSKPRQLPPAGTHVARCIGVVDLGTQRKSYRNEEKLLRQVRITWELPEEKAIFDEEKGEEPFLLSRDYTLSLFEKANLRHDLESWRGVAFTADELKGFDVFQLAGIPCLLGVIHKKSMDGSRTYANIGSISKLPKSMKCPEQIKESLTYEIGQGREGSFNDLPDWLKKQIESSQEFENGEVTADTKGGFPPRPQHDEIGMSPDDDSPLPF